MVERGEAGFPQGPIRKTARTQPRAGLGCWSDRTGREEGHICEELCGGLDWTWWWFGEMDSRINRGSDKIGDRIDHCQQVGGQPAAL